MTIENSILPWVTLWDQVAVKTGQSVYVTHHDWSFGVSPVNEGVIYALQGYVF
jgi:hypothetical protein